MVGGRGRGLVVHGLVDVFAGAVGRASYIKGSASAAVSAAARCETPSPGGGRRRRRRTRGTTALWRCWSAAQRERRSLPPLPGGGGWPARRSGRGRRCRCAAGHPSGSPDPGRCACCPGKSEHTSRRQKPRWVRANAAAARRNGQARRGGVAHLLVWGWAVFTRGALGLGSGWRRRGRLLLARAGDRGRRGAAARPVGVARAWMVD